MYNLFTKLKERIFATRLTVLLSLMFLLTGILFVRLFVLQIIRGKSYQDNYDLRIEKQQLIDAARGNIYDRNGNLLAYNKLSYAVTIEDTGNYETLADKNEKLNDELSKVITQLESNGDHIDNDFNIYIDSADKYQFSVSGTSLQRFRADIYGKSDPNDLGYNRKLGYDTSKATADQIMKYLMAGDKMYGISEKKFGRRLAYEIAIIRYKISLNAFKKYVGATIATGVSDESVAFVKENSKQLTGIDVKETMIRQYADAEAFSSIIGYTGTISTDQYKKLSKSDDTVSMSDKVGKTGIEEAMDSYLTGKKGSQTVYVDNVGTPLLVADKKEPVSGSDVYLSIDKNLQLNAYKILEQEIAGILIARLANSKTVAAGTDSVFSKDLIAVYDAYVALVNNQLINTDRLTDDDATDLEKQVAAAFDAHYSSSQKQLRTMLTASSSHKYKDLDKEYQAYMTYIVKMLKSEGVFDSELIDTSDDVQTQWANEQLSVNDYLHYAIEKGWIDVTSISSSTKYLDSDDAYNELVNYIIDDLDDDSGFMALVRKYTVMDDEVTGGQLCAILYDQGVLPKDDDTRNALASGGMSSFSFLVGKLKSLEITPGQIGLTLCSGSAVVISPKTGEVLACVSYPGYDSNRLANATDSSYYAYLLTSSSKPLYNYATQQKTAPGSTFKPMTATASLGEGIIDTSSTVTDEGVFTKVSNKPVCWSYPRFTHGTINVEGAIRHSCNYFFYEMGWRLATRKDGSYNDAEGIAALNKYADMYGLDQKTGVEIPEATSDLATQYPVMAAIGQSNTDITTIALARYAAAITNDGTVYGLTLLDHVADHSGKTIKKYAPEVKNQITVLNSQDWNAIHAGMHEVTEDLATFHSFTIPVGGKTGTAQSSKSAPPHALFMGFAPFDDPQLTVAVRIPFGYSSHYAADVGKNIIGVYLNEPSSMALLNGQAFNVDNSSTSD